MPNNVTYLSINLKATQWEPVTYNERLLLYYFFKLNRVILNVI